MKILLVVSLLFLYGLLLIGTMGHMLFVLISFFTGAPFVPSTRDKVKTMVALLKVKRGEKAADLGSGDGRVLIALAEAGAEAHGYEINPWLVWYARYVIRKAGLKGRAFVHWKNFWRVDLSNFDIITVYGITDMMKGLEKKLLRELKPGARVVSSGFTFTAWPPAETEEKVYLYEQPNRGPSSSE